MSEYNNLSENELQAIIDQAEKVLKNKKLQKRKEIIVQIKLLADSINANVDISEEGSSTDKKRKKVAPKYRNPNDNSQTWTGRGVPPKWVQALTNAGHDRSEFLI